MAETLMNDEELVQRLLARGYRIATYGDMPVTVYVCKHGKIQKQTDEDHPCVWTPIVERNSNG